MEKEYVMQIAQTIKEQLIGLTPMPVLMSWGISEFAATIFKNLPALRIKVNGLLHAGYVIIALNGSDYYEVYLLKDKDVECVNEEVCFNELGDVIDRAIECGTDKEEYEKNLPSATHQIIKRAVLLINRKKRLVVNRQYDCTGGFCSYARHEHCLTGASPE